MNKKELEGKVAIVTGGGSGIGKMSALSYAESGAKVVVADISERDGQNVTDEIVEKGGEAIFVKTDVSQAQDNENLVNKALEVYGKLDIAFNNAGIKGPIAPLAAVSYTHLIVGFIVIRFYLFLILSITLTRSVQAPSSSPNTAFPFSVIA